MKKLEYELLNGVHYDGETYVYDGRDINAIANLVESLRNVARAADKLDMAVVVNIQDTEEWASVYQEVKRYRKFANALPEWVLESDE